MASDSLRPHTRELLLAKFEALNDVDAFFLIQGREFLQETFQEKFPERVKPTETGACWRG